MPSSISSLTFDPARPHMLILGFVNNTIQIFDAEERHFPSWSRHLLASLPSRLTTQLHDPLMGAVFEPPRALSVKTGKDGVPQKTRPAALCLWGSTWLCRVDIAAAAERADKGYLPTGKRRRRSEKDAGPEPPVLANGTLAPQRQSIETCFRFVRKYQPIIGMDFINEAEMVVVERPLADILVTLPNAFFKPKYGVS